MLRPWLADPLGSVSGMERIAVSHESVASADGWKPMKVMMREEEDRWGGD